MLCHPPGFQLQPPTHLSLDQIPPGYISGFVFLCLGGILFLLEKGLEITFLFMIPDPPTSQPGSRAIRGVIVDPVSSLCDL